MSQPAGKAMKEAESGGRRGAGFAAARAWLTTGRGRELGRLWGRRLLRLGGRLRRAGRAAWARLRRTGALITARIADRWRRSLQFRVITVTFVVSGLVVVVLGFVLMQQIAQDIIASKEKATSNIASVGLSVADSWPGVDRTPDSSARSIMNAIAAKLKDTGATTGTDYAVMVTVPVGRQGNPVFSGGAYVGFGGAVPVPPHKLARVVDAENGFANNPVEVEPTTLDLPGSPSTPALAYGAAFGTGYHLYYFFPLTAEQQSLEAAQRTLLLVGLAVVVLLAAIAWLVTRWVVSPVRLAAQGALRLAAGHLGERMQVRGSDDLAALATSFNQMAESLQDKLRELEDLSQVQRQFVSDVSHELRTPLTTIRIAADVLYGSREDMDQAAGRSAELLQSQLERFESLLVDLLEISRYDANAATLDAEPVDICDVARQSADVAQQLAERRGAKIEFRLPPEPCVAEADRRRVERILRNLLVNAVEHGENKDAVVTVAADTRSVAVSVRDFGVGLRPGEAQLVFDRFWRADPARARTTGGTGLGLAIALEDARLHGGWLEAWGEPGRGSVFRLTLPRVIGGFLAGSPLALVPGPGDVEPALAELPALGTGAGDDGPSSTSAEVRARG